MEQTVLFKRNDYMQEDGGKVPLKGILKKGDTRITPEKWVDGMNLPPFEVKGRAAPEKNQEQPNPELEKYKLFAKKLKSDLDNLQKKFDLEVRGAHDKGYEEGKAQGLKQGQDQAKARFENDLAALKENLAGAFMALSGEKQEFFNDLQEGAVQLVLSMFRKLAGDCADHYHDLIIQTLNRGMELLGKEEHLVIRINPAEVEHVQKNEEFWNPVNSRVQDVRIEGDPRIQKGGCLIESSSGTIDLRIDAMRTMLEEAFLKVHENRKNIGE